MGIHGGKHFRSLEYCIPGSVLVAVLTKRLAGGRPSSNQWWSVFAFSFWIKPHTTVSHVCHEWNCIQITHVMCMNVKWDYTLVYICYHSATRSYSKSLWDKSAYTGRSKHFRSLECRIHRPALVPAMARRLAATCHHLTSDDFQSDQLIDP